ncbi:MAG TPA: ribonuclease P protein component 1 [Methanosarcinaceae archaeon]|nr:ribonuclease P protein component 1 [Methanosarcinaceae archaeon]
MDITPSNLIYHELIGLMVKVVNSTNPTLIDIRGKVVDETRNTLIVETCGAREIVVPKTGTIFVFRIHTRPAGGHDVKHVKVNGTLLLSQPENRIKNIRKNHMR